MSDFELLAMQLFLWSPSILFGTLFAYSFWREPRQFRNALFLLMFTFWTSLLLLMRYGQQWMILPLAILVVAFPFIAVVALTVNGVIVIRRNGLSASSLLPIALALLIAGVTIGAPFIVGQNFPRWVTLLIILFEFEALWFSFTLVALLLYSFLYRAIPRRRTYDYIIIHGAGLDGREPSPTLAGRIEKALELWGRQGRQGVLIASGGQGADEEASEAEAMRCYLLRRDVPADAILLEDRSTTTWENLRFSKEIMDARSSGEAYRAAVVSSDYHVFRCAEYAKDLGIPADGVGSHTRSWAWPSAFIREVAAITRAHAWPYAVIFLLWLVVPVLELIN